MPPRVSWCWAATFPRMSQMLIPYFRFQSLKTLVGLCDSLTINSCSLRRRTALHSVDTHKLTPSNLRDVKSLLSSQAIKASKPHAPLSWLLDLRSGPSVSQVCEWPILSVRVVVILASRMHHVRQSALLSRFSGECHRVEVAEMWIEDRTLAGEQPKAGVDG